MNVSSAADLESVLFTGYILCFVLLNAVIFLISLFYRKKFHHSSPRWGFLTAIILALFYCLLLFASRNGSEVVHGAAQLSLAGSALASVMSTVKLFLIMQRVRK
jgi:hypothetical protein